jgi:hypothetical protein
LRAATGWTGGFTTLFIGGSFLIDFDRERDEVFLTVGGARLGVYALTVEVLIDLFRD